MQGVLPSLRALCLRSNQITDSGCVALDSALRNGALPMLSYLIARENSTVQGACVSVEALVSARRDARIVELDASLE